MVVANASEGRKKRIDIKNYLLRMLLFPIISLFEDVSIKAPPVLLAKNL